MCLAGSAPEGAPQTVYRDLAAAAAARGADTVVDAAGGLLLDALEARPFLIKPNQHELGALFGVRISTYADAVCYARRLQACGARNVLVSFGGAGAVFVPEAGEAMWLSAPQGKLVARGRRGGQHGRGLPCGWQESGEGGACVPHGGGGGSASAFSSGFASREEVGLLYEKIQNCEQKPALIRM